MGLFLALTMVLTLGLGPNPALAQNPFAPAVRINDTIVTNYEIDQRALFLEVLRTPGDLRALALEALVNERLQVAEAQRMEVVATPEEIEAGVAEFAGRAELGSEQFIRALGEEGVAPETIRDFVANGIAWRNVVQARFGPGAAATEREAREALLFSPRLTDARILVAEIVIPVTPQNQENLRSELARLGADVNGSFERFSAAARQFSASQTRENDGLTGWRPLAEVPPALRDPLVLLTPGEVFGPVPLGPAMAIFQLRGLQESQFRAPDVLAIEYATIPLPGLGGEETTLAAQALRADVDVCQDLYGERPAGSFEIVEAPLRDIPGDIAMALAALDEGEISFDVRRAAPGQAGIVTLAVMMCNRVMELPPEGGLAAVQNQLFSAHLQAQSVRLLEELRADAIIDFNP